MTEAELLAQTTRVLVLAVGLGTVFGALAQRTHFCTMGAVSDVVALGDWGRMRMWVMAMGVAIIGFNLMVGLGAVRAADTLYAGEQLRWLSHALGGLAFGFGMVLASGCGSKTLVRIGGGNLKSLVVALVLGFTALVSLRGLGAQWRGASVDAVVLTLPGGQDLPSLLAAPLGAAADTLAPWLGAGIGLALIGWVLARTEGRRAEAWLGGMGVGAVVVAMWWVSGQLGWVDEHPQTLESAFIGTASQRMESLSFVAPLGLAVDGLAYWGAGGRMLTLGVAAAIGVVAGSAAVALATGSFRWEGFAGVEDTANHLVGAVLMGSGGVAALGCTIGQGLSGLSTLAVGSMVSLAGILAGGVLGVRWQMWRLERAA